MYCVSRVDGARARGGATGAHTLSARPTRTLVYTHRHALSTKPPLCGHARLVCGTCPHICDQRKVMPLESSSLQRPARIPGDLALWRHSAACCSRSQRLPSFHLMPSQASPSAALGCHLPTCTPSPASTCGTQRRLYDINLECCLRCLLVCAPARRHARCAPRSSNRAARTGRRSPRRRRP